MSKAAYNFFNDRRKFERKPLELVVQLKIGVHLKGVGFIRNMSRNGACISSPELFAFFKPEQAHVFEDAQISISFPSESLTVEGTVIRVDVFKDEFAVQIDPSSLGQEWEPFTEKNRPPN
ncbi:MAG: PilZ domain-containing protein [Desulfomonilia bacterium]|nr:PilZ domain-containing protein [Desulfomonilia bacterium]